MRITTFKQWVDFLRNELDEDKIFDTFENLSDDLRTEIYEFGDINSREPFRASMIAIGEQYDVEFARNW